MNKIEIPKTKAELAVSHSFSAFIYPQVIEGITASIAKLCEKFYNLSQINLIGGITKITKNFKKELYKRRRLGNYEAFQIVPKMLEYDLTLDKVVFYNVNNDYVKLVQIENNGFIKQNVPFIIEEVVKTPNGNIKEKTFYIDCWIAKDDMSLDLKEDLLVVKNLDITCSGFITSDILNVITETGNLVVNTILQDFRL